MSHPPISLRLDHRRLEQLKAISTALQLTNAGTIASMIREKIAAGVIPDVIPGILVEKVADGIRIAIDDNPVQTLVADHARVLAGTIRAVANGDPTPRHINLDYDFSVARRGTGIMIAIPFVNGDEASFPADLALDFAELIEKAAA
jgi:hypothetical protein